MAKQRKSACFLNHETVVRMASEGRSLSDIGRTVGTKTCCVRQYIHRYQIPYQPFQQSGKNNPSWKGGRMLDKHGYVLLLMPEHPHADRHGYVREHRIVMEKTLGRLLDRKEVVHHIDGNRGNNAPENLGLFATNADHLRHTLKGRCPNWTPQGKANILQSCRSQKERRAAASRSASGTDAQPLPESNALRTS
jgi:hypothetical protein